MPARTQSVWQRRQFSLFALFFQMIFLVLFSIFCRYIDPLDDSKRIYSGTDYPLFQDVHLMIFRYGFSAVSVNLLLSAFVIQWAMLLRGFLSKQFQETALVGKKKNVMELDEQGSIHHSDLFSMIGTLLLWVFFPSFNAAVQEPEDARHRAIMNTYLAMASGTVTTFILSSFVDNLGRFNMIHIQSSTLSGGVAIGSAANAVLYPSHAVAVGICASFVSVIGHAWLSPKFEKRFKLFDTCGVHNLHGIPGILAGIFSIIFALGYEPESYGKTLYHIYPYFEGGPMEGDRNRETQALYQLAGMGTALASAVVGGLMTGLILQIRILNQVDDPDTAHGDINYYAQSEFNFLSKYQRAREQEELMERERLHEIY
ncbi:unnamed protein product [Nippostrongylus brasiliensis]|uniref:Ammonium_transp domain-containing protein n=1 Tax=Nippostrongylus brasiliensis TaxID=27835 RepID=A0A0N4Y2K0_NIPBR|nr:unnamed protein product [Nippostrongylus brasiliensis]